MERVPEAKLNAASVYDPRVEEGKLATAKARVSVWGSGKKCHSCGPDPRGSICHQAVSSHRILSIPSWGAYAACLCWGTQDLGPLPLGEHTACLILWQYSTGIDCSRHTSNSPVVASIVLPLPRPTEQMSPNKLLLSHPLVWERKRHWRAPYRGGTKTKEEHQRLCEQRKGKGFTFAGAKNYIPIISPRLWTWGSCGLWEQVQLE